MAVTAAARHASRPRASRRWQADHPARIFIGAVEQNGPDDVGCLAPFADGELRAGAGGDCSTPQGAQQPLCARREQARARRWRARLEMAHHQKATTEATRGWRCRPRRGSETLIHTHTPVSSWFSS